ncbi:MAG: SapC family protein [Gammaproteobacteria bacterium]|nr:SapC family protein [Gammaproteobacteria bacterium]
MTNEPTSRTVEQAPGAARVFYKQPELITPEEHSNLGLNKANRPFDFCSSVRAVPLTAVEMNIMQRHCPIIFSSVEEPSLLAVVGVVDDENLFVDENGRWETGVYIPAYLRCHPFALVAHETEDFAVAVDLAATTVAEGGEPLIFDGKELSAPANEIVQHCLLFDAQAKITAEFCNRLAELELLTGQELSLAPDEGGEETVVAKYVAVDFRKLEAIDAETLQKLHKDGTLAAIYAHRFSLDTWRQLLQRRVERKKRA